MANEKVFKARVQLKSHPQSEWKKVEATFIPLLGELIIYSADQDHNYPRLKVGDGSSTLDTLHFIDAGTINGALIPESNLSFHTTFNQFPQQGVGDKLYIDLTTQRIYCYSASLSQYTQLSHFDFTINTTPTNVAVITNWQAGTAATATLSEGVLNITTGTKPRLDYSSIQVVKEVTKG